MSRTLEEAIIWYDGLAKDAGATGFKAAEEINRQLAAWLRELQERRKAPEIIRCSECEHFRKENNGEMWCRVSNGHSIDKNFFCGDAEGRLNDQARC